MEHSSILKSESPMGSLSKRFSTRSQNPECTCLKILSILQSKCSSELWLLRWSALLHSLLMPFNRCHQPFWSNFLMFGKKVPLSLLCLIMVWLSVLLPVSLLSWFYPLLLFSFLKIEDLASFQGRDCTDNPNLMLSETLKAMLQQKKGANFLLLDQVFQISILRDSMSTLFGR